MTEILRLTMVHEDQEWSAELKKESIILDELTWEWIKGAFAAIGFSSKDVDEFFNESNDREGK